MESSSEETWQTPVGFIILHTARLFIGDTRDFAKANCNLYNLADGSIIANPKFTVTV